MRRLFVSIAFLSALSLIASNVAVTQTASGTLGGVVKDPTGAVIAGAQVSVRNEATGETRNATTDDEGRFKIEGLAPGRYSLSVSQTGFKDASRNVQVEAGRGAKIEIQLEVAAPRAEIDVGAKGGIAPNMDPNYRSLREGEIFESYEVKDLVVKRDAGTFTFRSGRISFLSPVMSRVVKAVFVGEGEFALVPVPPLERDYLRTVTERETVEEAFSKAAFCFTDGTYEEIKAKSQPASEPSGARDLLGDFYKRVRDRSGGGDNVEAEILADIYNSQRAGFFSAYIFGRKYDDLRYGVFPLGAIPRLAPEEVVLVNANSSDEKRGIWYLAHLADEYKSGTASSLENKHIIDVEHYQIETVIDGGEKLTSSAELTFTALSNGDRVLGFGLLPYLRVTRVRVADDREINFIQERSNQDGSFYAILPEPLVKGRKYKLTIEYQGNKVIEDAGGGNFAIGARTSWYPSINSFNDRATFDIIFKVPKQYTLVGVGKEVKNWKEGDFAASQWVSEVPLAVAGFNYGLFKKKELTDSVTGYKIEGYATPTVPGYLRAAAEEISLSPSRMIDGTMVDAQNSMRIFTHWFGEAPYGRIAITQQPQPNFGQSWPTLVYLPLIAYLDSTQRSTTAI